MIDTQYGITIMGGREVSRPYRFFSPKARGFLCFLFRCPPVFIHRTNKRGTLLITPKHAEGMSLRYGVVFLVGGVEEFGAEGVVVAEGFEVGGGWVGFEGGSVGGEGIVAAHHTL